MRRWLPVPALGSGGLLLVRGGVGRCLLADRPLRTLVSSPGTSQSPGGGSPRLGGRWRTGVAAARCRARTRRGQKRGEPAAPTW